MSSRLGWGNCLEFLAKIYGIDKIPENSKGSTLGL